MFQATPDPTSPLPSVKLHECQSSKIYHSMLSRIKEQRIDIQAKQHTQSNLLGGCRLRRLVWKRTTKFTNISEIKMWTHCRIWRDSIDLENSTNIRNLCKCLSCRMCGHFTQQNSLLSNQQDSTSTKTF